MYKLLLFVLFNYSSNNYVCCNEVHLQNFTSNGKVGRLNINTVNNEVQNHPAVKTSTAQSVTVTPNVLIAKDATRTGQVNTKLAQRQLTTKKFKKKTLLSIKRRSGNEDWIENILNYRPVSEDMAIPQFLPWEPNKKMIERSGLPLIDYKTPNNLVVAQR